jgi:hypothetical protein
MVRKDAAPHWPQQLKNKYFEGQCKIKKLTVQEPVRHPVIPGNLLDKRFGVVAAAQQSESRPCSASVVVTNRVPRSRAMSLLIWSPFFFINVSADAAMA